MKSKYKTPNKRYKKYTFTLIIIITSQIRRPRQHLCKLLLSHSIGLITSIRLRYHQLQLIISHSLTKLLGNSLEVLKRDNLIILTSKQLERPLDLLLGLFLVHFCCHYLEELGVVDCVCVLLVFLLGVYV